MVMESTDEVLVEIFDYMLTPLSCSSLINEIIKGLIYQKCQIPYPYNWLESTVIRRRKQEREAENKEIITDIKKNVNFTVENHFRMVSKLYDDLERAMKEISRALCETVVSEIVIVFGPTPVCPKEVCRIKIPKLAFGHFEESHINDALKHQHKALRQVFLSNTWMDTVDSGIACTNTYIFIRKYEIGADDIKQFKPCRPLNFHNSVKMYCINLKWKLSGDHKCCKNLVIYSENPESQRETKIEPLECTTDQLTWFQFEHYLQGFKNCYINRTAACDLW